MKTPATFSAGDATILLQDALAGMAEQPDRGFDLAIADPPYGASTTATWRLPDGHGLPGMGGQWKLAAHTWDQFSNVQGFEATLCWLNELKRLVKPTW